LEAWAARFVADGASVKQFVLERGVVNLDVDCTFFFFFCLSLSVSLHISISVSLSSSLFPPLYLPNSLPFSHTVF